MVPLSHIQAHIKAHRHTYTKIHTFTEHRKAFLHVNFSVYHQNLLIKPGGIVGLITV